MIGGESGGNKSVDGRIMVCNDKNDGNKQCNNQPTTGAVKANVGGGSNGNSDGSGGGSGGQ
jgi:hypothetical protein